MKLGSALFVFYLLIFTVCFSYPMAHIAGNLRTRYLEGVEEPLVDQANILAVILGQELEAGRFRSDDLFETFQGVYARTLSAKIYDLEKDQVDIRVYITDREGKILFDSRDREMVGEDYGQWRDVRLTLEGEYGARTTLDDPLDANSSVLYVAAPIRVNGEIAGVLTVAKPTTSVNTFMASAKPAVFRIGAISGLVAVFLSLLVSWWVSRQIHSLTNYANDVREGLRVELPNLASTELREMGVAFDMMKESLEGRKYIEKYVQTLTHEIKSPVSAIQGAAELLEEEMPREQRMLFLSNIRSETDRIQDLVDRMLRLSELETRKSLETIEVIPLAPLVRTILEGKIPLLSVKNLQVRAEIEEKLSLKGDSFLLHQAVSNLVQNAIDFSPANGKIAIRARGDGSKMKLEVEDEGPGIPDYARNRVFEKFFSLKRPDTGKKSTGLGLNFVKEVVSLHDGEIRLDNLGKPGFRASIVLPAWEKKEGDHSRIEIEMGEQD